MDDFMRLLRYLPLFLLSLAAQAQFLKSEVNKTKFEGLFDFYYVPDKGKVFLAINEDQLGQDFLYVHALRTGLGSNDIGLDRGQLGGAQIVRFEKAGPRILLMAPNMLFRAQSSNPLERQSVREAFGTHVLFGFEITETDQNKFLVDRMTEIIKGKNTLW